LAKTISDVSGGDLRKSITTLQMAYSLYGDKINAASIIEISGVGTFKYHLLTFFVANP
jgi:hypothetical protein